MQAAVYMRYVRVEGMQWCYSGSNGMVWYGMVWYGMQWYAMVLYGSGSLARLLSLQV